MIRKSLGKRMLEHWQLYVLLLPALTIIFIFNYVPMYGIQIAFKNFNASKGIWGSPWVGFAHFQRLMNLPALIQIVRNTFLLSIMNLTIGFSFPIILALILNQIHYNFYKRVIQTVTYLPYFISTVVIVGMLLLFLSPRTGLYAIVMDALGKTPLNLLGKTDYFRWIYVISGIWQHMGWNSIIYLAAMSSIDPELYEAAVIDGANQWRRMIHIDIPCLVPTIIILLILSSGNVLNVGFDKVFLMQNPSNLEVSEIIATYVYKIGIISAQFSFSTAVSLLNTFVNFVFLVSVNAITRRLGEVSLW